MTPSPPKSAMDLHMGYLINLLEDEFLSREGVRVSGVFPSTLKRSPDLPQDYDPEGNNLHTKRGVKVSVFGREYFFPVQWAIEANQTEIFAQIEIIRDRLNSY